MTCDSSKKPARVADSSEPFGPLGCRGADFTPASDAVKVSLTGIKPTSTPHLGNYLGAIRPALALRETYATRYFIADYHALTTMREPTALRESVYDVAATWLACGLDPEETLLYRQSAVPEVFELAWILSCFVATGQLERGHSYKDAKAKGESPNAGVFNYPVLMAADILLFDADVVPVGKDQKQHLELCRDMATRINHHYGAELLRVPEPHAGDAPLVLGTDGEKMSKSRGNGIPLFASSKELRGVVMSIKTGSETLEEPKDPEASTVWQLCRQVSESAAADMAEKLRAGGYGWGHAKQDLYEALEAELGPRREMYGELRADTERLDMILDAGAAKAKVIAQQTLQRVRSAIGMSGPMRRDAKATVRLKPYRG